MNNTAEQQARDMLERMDVEGAQNMSAGDVVELANLIARRNADTRILETALDLAYSLLNAVVEQNGTLRKDTINEIRKMLPARFPASFAAREKT